SAELKVGTYKVTFAKSAVPKRLALYQNMPNPFNPVTDIKFDLPEKAKVRLEVYNMLGQKIRTLVDGELEPGTHTVRWDGKDQMGRDAASGVYFYKLTADGKTFTRKMMLLR
ncbi:T9SS type A sorting domain-containing protein, partial [bacterium]|nr:T9SS type A sorting domain-containing protein [bacterium]